MLVLGGWRSGAGSRWRLLGSSWLYLFTTRRARKAKRRERRAEPSKVEGVVVLVVGGVVLVLDKGKSRAGSRWREESCWF